MSTIFVSVMTLFFLVLVIAFNVATLRNLRRIPRSCPVFFRDSRTVRYPGRPPGHRGSGQGG